MERSLISVFLLGSGLIVVVTLACTILMSTLTAIIVGYR